MLLQILLEAKAKEAAAPMPAGERRDRKILASLSPARFGDLVVPKSYLSTQHSDSWKHT